MTAEVAAPAGSYPICDDAIVEIPSCHISTKLNDPSREFVSNNESFFIGSSLVRADIGATDTAILDLDQNLIRIRSRSRNVRDLDLPYSPKNRRFQGSTHSCDSYLTRVNFFDAETSPSEAPLT